MTRYRLMPIYLAGAYLSALSLVLICGLITAQILLRLLDRLLLIFGAESFGWSVPGLSEISGFLLVGASFMGLAYTFAQGGHIRVTLLIGRLGPKIRVWLEVWCLSIALALCLFLAWYSAFLIHDSWTFNELSYGLLRIPLWIPQSVMLAGVVLFCLALIESWLATLLCALRSPSHYVPDDQPQE